MSSITKGEQMLPVLNCLGIKAAVYGNHDFGMWWNTIQIYHCALQLWMIDENSAYSCFNNRLFSGFQGFMNYDVKPFEWMAFYLHSNHAKDQNTLQTIALSV